MSLSSANIFTLDMLKKKLVIKNSYLFIYIHNHDYFYLNG